MIYYKNLYKLILKNKKKHYDPRGILIGERQGKNLFHVEKVEGGGSITKY